MHKKQVNTQWDARYRIINFELLFIHVERLSRWRGKKYTENNVNLYDVDVTIRRWAASKKGKKEKNSWPVSFNLALQLEWLNGSQLNAIVIFLYIFTRFVVDYKDVKGFAVVKRVLYNLHFSLDLKPFYFFISFVSHSFHPFKINSSVAAIDDIKSQVHCKATSTTVQKQC